MKGKPKSKRRSRTTGATSHERTRARQIGTSIRQLRQEQAEAEHSLCACGCGGTPKSKRSKFLMGHDMRMRPGSAWRKEHPELFAIGKGGGQ